MSILINHCHVQLSLENLPSAVDGNNHKNMSIICRQWKTSQYSTLSRMSPSNISHQGTGKSEEEVTVNCKSQRGCRTNQRKRTSISTRSVHNDWETCTGFAPVCSGLYQKSPRAKRSGHVFPPLTSNNIQLIITYQWKFCFLQGSLTL